MKQLEERNNELTALCRQANIDARKGPRKEYSDNFTNKEASHVAYLTIERLMPDRVFPKFSFDKWEQMLFRHIYKFLKNPVASLNESTCGPVWLLPILAKIPEITPMRR